ncbi:MAG: tRNA dihydrouridine synthase DusB [Caulobacteraceae bacterium]|nr:tRNA dihydrouridine synthase DusB [Caulobacteraceae bacterium]
MGIDFSTDWTHRLGRVWLAPMTGVSDLPYRQTAAALGARYQATEMVACDSLLASRPDVLRRAAIGEDLPVMVVQLVGHDPRLVAEAARLSAAAGAEIIDVNFGCPAKAVTGQACGSALMREPDRIAAIVAAACEAVDVPITVKMRLGWDSASLNAPEVAEKAVAAGARAVTVHGRTRAQFYTGIADWAAIREVAHAAGAPVIANGDIRDSATARSAMALSGASAVMIGRSAIGRPWIGRAIESALSGGPAWEPGPTERLAIVVEHLRRSLSFYGDKLGALMFRKHLAAYIDAAPWPEDAQARREARARLCRLPANEIEEALAALWTPAMERLAA